MLDRDRRYGMAVGDETVVTITDMSTSGEGIGHFEGYTLFIKGAVIGDVVRVRLTMAKKTYGYAEVTETVTPSPDRVEPPCPIAGICGGCTMQAVSYPAQLRYKKAEVVNDLKRIGGLDLPVNEVIGMEKPLRYRNKAQYPVGIDRDGRIVCGFYAGRSHTIIPAEDCLISGECDAAVIREVTAFMRERGIAPYDEKSGQGVVRHILIRRGEMTGEVMVCLIVTSRGLTLESSDRPTGTDNSPAAQALWTELAGRLNDIVPGLKSFCLNINDRRDNVILGRTVVPVYGEPYIHDKIGDLTFRISPLSFYQVNPIQTKKLYDTVKRFAALTGEETVLDLYCGIGTIGLYLAEAAKEVRGVEIVPQAVKDAAENAARNGTTNARFVLGASEDIFKDLPDAQVVVLDPPRKGCDEKLLAGLIERAPERIVYVSCNPSTLARDLKILEAGGYEVGEVQPCDMFPMTQHIETVVRLSRKL